MERCPNCGEPARPGARFCTICGFRIADDDLGNGPSNTISDQDPDAGDDDAAFHADAVNGWPAAPAMDDSSTVSSGWGAARFEPERTADEAPERAAGDEEPASIWAANASGAWPAPPVVDPSPPIAPVSTESTEIEAVSDEVVAIAPVPVTNGEPATNPRARAERLLDELRDAIAAMDGAAAIDLSGVISELEVAVTPPGAIDPDDLAALRETLLAARARPRDLDTVLDLTNRIDAMVALVFAYDRTIAAIERALEVLRRPPARAETEGE